MSQALELLDGQFAPLADGVADGRYAFWLGSGVSRGRVPDLGDIVLKVLEHLRARIDPIDPECPFRKAFDQALELAHLRPDELATIDVTDEARSWPAIEQAVSGLVERYALLLDIRVPGPGRPADYLLWEAVDVRGSYPATIEPDCEHLCLAILGLEGVVPEAASANWDGLIESAVDELAGEVDAFLKVVVMKDDLREPDRRTRLLKFHGCAIRATEDPDTYRGALVASESQITGYVSAPETRVIGDALKSLAITKPTFMIGLSAQDSNIQYIFASAKEDMPWIWPADPPAHIFASDALGANHRNLLKVVYRAYYEAQGDAIEREVLLRAYAQQALLAMVLHVVTAKLRALVGLAEATHLDARELAVLGGSLTVLRDSLAEHAEPNRLDFVRTVVRAEGRGLALFQNGVEPPAGDPPRYLPIGAVPVDQIATTPGLDGSGLRELATALALLGRGAAAGVWHVSEGTTALGRRGALRVVTASGLDAALYFVANETAAVRLQTGGMVEEDDEDVVVIHSTKPVEELTRSSRRRFGRTGGSGPRHVDVCALLSNSRSLNELDDGFRREASL